MEVARAAAMNNVEAMWFEGNFKEYDLISAGGNGQMLTRRIEYRTRSWCAARQVTQTVGGRAMMAF